MFPLLTHPTPRSLTRTAFFTTKRALSTTVDEKKLLDLRDIILGRHKPMLGTKKAAASIVKSSSWPYHLRGMYLLENNNLLPTIPQLSVGSSWNYIVAINDKYWPFYAKAFWERSLWEEFSSGWALAALRVNELNYLKHTLAKDFDSLKKATPDNYDRLSFPADEIKAMKKALDMLPLPKNHMRENQATLLFSRMYRLPSLILEKTTSLERQKELAVAWTHISSHPIERMAKNLKIPKETLQMWWQDYIATEGYRISEEEYALDKVIKVLKGIETPIDTEAMESNTPSKTL